MSNGRDIACTRRAGTQLAFALAALLAAAGTTNGQNHFNDDQRELLLCAGHVDTSQRLGTAIEKLCGPEVKGQRAVLQLNGPITDQRRALLADAGVRLGGYLPQDAFVVRLEEADPDAIRKLGFVTWQSAFDASWKLDPKLGLVQHRDARRKAIEAAGELVVVMHLFDDASQAEITGVRAALIQSGAEVFTSEVVGGITTITARMPSHQIEQLAQLDAVQFIENAPEITLRNASVRGVVQSGTPGVEPVYANGLTGLNQIIGVMDGKVDVFHCSFEDPINPIGPLHRKIQAYNAPASGFNNHGTHVAGTALGESDPANTNDLRGVAYDSRLVFSETPSYTELAMRTTLDLHHSQGARIHTNSWGNDLTEAYDGLARAIDSFSYDNEDDLVIFAASNDAALHNPENAKNALAVGSTLPSPNQNNYHSGGVGPTADGRRKPELFAPGQNTMSANPSTACGVFGLSGTSMAAPAIAGAAALSRQYFEDGFYPTGVATPSDTMTPTGALLKAVLINAGEDMTGVPGYPTNNEGWGRLVLDGALEFAGDTRNLWVQDVRKSSGIATGSVVSHQITVNGSGEKLKVTLAWMDPPAMPGTTFAPVNDLDLEIVAPDATTYKGNVFVGGVSAPGGSADAINNVEQVHIDAPATGTWTIRVRGTSINEGTQGFAIVATGEVTPLSAGPSIVAIDPPEYLEPLTPVTFQVRIDPGDDAVLGGTEQLAFRTSGAVSFSTIPLTPLGGSLYEASIPAPNCGDAPEFFVQASMASAGLITSPADAPGSTFVAQVGTFMESSVWSQDFESGLPGGFTAGGLWHVTSGCMNGTPCDGSTQWAYFGQEPACNYQVGAARQQGSLVTPPIAIPAADHVTLTFCSNLVTEQFTGVDEPTVIANGMPLVAPLVSIQNGWEVREVDLTQFAGGNTTLEFEFDSVDGFSNAFLGWQIDNLEITASDLQCNSGPGCPGDVNGDLAVNSTDIGYVIFRLGMTGTPGTVDGDANADGSVDSQDISYVIFRLAPCP